MFAIYATQAAPDDPLSALVVGELPQPAVREVWVRVKISHVSLNRHDLFTLRGITAHPEGISFPMILGNDGVGCSCRDRRAACPRHSFNSAALRVSKCGQPAAMTRVARSPRSVMAPHSRP
jgi:hypothetical protein